jgi:hypothetical protein
MIINLGDYRRGSCNQLVGPFSLLSSFSVVRLQMASPSNLKFHIKSIRGRFYFPAWAPMYSFDSGVLLEQKRDDFTCIRAQLLIRRT